MSNLILRINKARANLTMRINKARTNLEMRGIWKAGTPSGPADILLLEIGDNLLLETGDNLALE